MEVARPNGWENIKEHTSGPDKDLTNSKRDEKAKKYEKNYDVESVSKWIESRLILGEGRYSEKIPLNSNGSINPEATIDIPRSMIVQYAKSLNLSSQNSLYILASDIAKDYPKIHFSFKPDSAGKYIEITVESEVKKSIPVGAFVNWENNQTLMWNQPRKITRIESLDGNKFAFFDESPTGIPMDELHLNDE